MSQHVTPLRRRIVTIGAAIVLASALAACGSDTAKVEVPEGGTGSDFNDAVLASESHDEVVFNDGSQMLVAVDCDSELGGTIVTVVSEGIAPGIYTGTFDPATDGSLQLDASVGGEASAQLPITLDADEYTVTFADLDGAVFTVSGCPS